MKTIRNKKGFTLIEVVVTVMIVTIVFATLASIVSFFAKFNRDENSALNNQENMRLLVLQLERDIRRSDQSGITIDGDCYDIGAGEQSTSIIRYCFNSNNVSRNGSVIAEEIYNFDLTEVGSAIDVNIESIQDTRGNKVDISTTIYLRKG